MAFCPSSLPTRGPTVSIWVREVSIVTPGKALLIAFWTLAATSPSPPLRRIRYSLPVVPASCWSSAPVRPAASSAVRRWSGAIVWLM